MLRSISNYDRREKTVKSLNDHPYAVSDYQFQPDQFLNVDIVHLETIKILKMAYDPSTSSNVKEVQTTHLELNLKVDFEHKILDGTVTLSLVALADNINKVILDTRNLEVKSVSQDGKELKVNILWV